ncbi:MAG: hypothetical protein RLZZ628_1719 [Bacteroidota bacterium]
MIAKIEPAFLLHSFQKSRDFVKSPMRYPGGKYYALKYILPFIDCLPHDEFREPFVGGGSVFFGKKKSKFNWINDLEIDIADIYKGLTDETVVQLMSEWLFTEVATPERHTEIKNWQTDNFASKVYKTYYLNRTSYSGIIHKPAWGYKEQKSSPPKNWIAFVEQAARKLQNVKITHWDFAQVVQEKAVGKQVLMYLDPPYFHADQKRAYTKPFLEQDHIRLCEELKNTNYYFCLSYDDCSEIRDLYDWAFIHERKWLYNTANKKGESRDLGNELIITNYKVNVNAGFFD